MLCFLFSNTRLSKNPHIVIYIRYYQCHLNKKNPEQETKTKHKKPATKHSNNKKQPTLLAT